MKSSALVVGVAQTALLMYAFACSAFAANTQSDRQIVEPNTTPSAAPLLYAYPLPLLPGASACYAYDLNDAGQVAGACAGLVGRGFVTGKNGSEITEVIVGEFGTAVTGINNVGQIVGSFTKASGVTAPFISDLATGITREVLVPPLATQADAVAINDRGQFIGRYYWPAPPNYYTHSYIGEFATAAIRDIDSLGGQQTYPYGINNRGMVVGASMMETHPFAPLLAFVTGPDGYGTNLVFPGQSSSSTAVAISEAGDIAGSRFIIEPRADNAFLLSAVGKLTTYTVPSGADTLPADLDANGHVLISAPTRSGNRLRHAYIGLSSGKLVDTVRLIANLPSGVHVDSPKKANKKGQFVGQASDGLAYIVCPTQSCL